MTLIPNKTTRTNKKTMSIFAIVGISAIIAITGITYIAAQGVEETVDTEPIPSQLPYEIKFRTGIPILRAVEVINPAESLYFHQIKQGEHEYLWRAVEKGSTFVSNKEMEVFFTSFDEKGYRFAMHSEDGTKLYRIYYSEPPISVNSHWVKIFVYDDNQPNAKSLSASDNSKLSLAIEKPFRWVPVDAQTAQSIKNLIEKDGQNFRTITEDGDKSIQVMYLGPLSEELKRPEFQAMYAHNLETRQ